MNNKSSLIFIFLINIAVSAQNFECQDLSKSIEDYENFYNSIKKDQIEIKARYSKAYLVATDICLCDKSKQYSIELAIKLLKIIDKKKSVFKLNSELINKTFRLCDNMSSLIILEESLGNNTGLNTSSSNGKRDSTYRLKIEYSDDNNNKLTDLRLMAANTTEKASEDSWKNELEIKYSKGEITLAEMIKKVELFNKDSNLNHTKKDYGLNQNTIERIKKILLTFD